MTWAQWLEGRASVRERRGHARNDAVRPGTVGAESAHGSVLDLASNDMLGLSAHPAVREAAAAAALAEGAGAGASRLVTGTLPLHRALETELAAWVGAPSALVFSSGYLANIGLLQALGGPGAVILLDAHAHASLWDGARLSRAEIREIPHSDTAAYREALESLVGDRVIVAVESVYSVLSDAAPLAELAQLCREFGALLFVDEAHGLGARGPLGRGLLAELGLWGLPGLELAATVTLSKALGAQGGAVLGSESLRRHLVSTARPFIFDTALAPASAAAALESVRLLADPATAAPLLGRLSRAVDDLSGTLHVKRPDGVVLSVPMPSAEAAVEAAAAFRSRGILVGCFRPPSVPDGISRLRFSASSLVDDDDVARLALAAAEILGPLGQAGAR